MLDVTSGEQAFQAQFPALFEATPSPVQEIMTVAKREPHWIHDLDYDGEAFYEASHHFERITKAHLLQRAIVKGYFYASFEVAELIFKTKQGFGELYNLNDAANKYNTFVHQAEKFLPDAHVDDIFTQKVTAALTEAHFKLALIYGKQSNMARSAHHMTQAAAFGHESAESLLPQIAHAA